ncbi:MFS transporter [Klebsiella pneumoniae]|nr:MFS transporter [Klebsiella pneumoniae]
MWLADVNHLTKTETGIVFSSISLFAIIFQPVFGLMSDKLGLRKHLLWTITGRCEQVPDMRSSYSSGAHPRGTS